MKKNIFKTSALIFSAALTLFTAACGSENSSSTPAGRSTVTMDIPSDSTADAPEETVTTVTSSKKSGKTTTSATTTSKTKKAKKATTRTTTTAAPTEEDEEIFSLDDGSYVEYHFRNSKLLNQHFEKHGGEFTKDFGYETAAEYEKGASDVINDPDALYKTEAEDGDGVYYIEATNEFVILSTDGYIRTYFRPSAGIDYFNRQ